MSLKLFVYSRRPESSVHCPDTNYQHQNKSTFLLFPSDILTVSLYFRVLSFKRNGLTALIPGSYTVIGKHLSALYISDNKLVSLQSVLFNGLHRLYELYLNDNYLESLPADLFNGLNELCWLHLDNNYMESLPADLFNGLHILYKLHLDNNHLKSLPADFFNDLHKLDWLTLDTNHLQ